MHSSLSGRLVNQFHPEMTCLRGKGVLSTKKFKQDFIYQKPVTVFQSLRDLQAIENLIKFIILGKTKVILPMEA